MPFIYLSPSSNEFNPFIDGGNEEYYMNLITDEMIPYLNSSGIKYIRNSPNRPVSSAINQANQNEHDLYLSLQSAQSPQSSRGEMSGTNVYYTPGSPESTRAANITAQNLKEIRPNPESVNLTAANNITQHTDSNAPAVSVELAYRDNPDDANWIRENIENIAKVLVQSLAEYFGIPLINPQANISTRLNNEITLYQRPSTESTVVTTIPSGANVLIIGEWEGWYVIDYLGTVGYAVANEINQ